MIAQYNGDNSILFESDTQCELYSEIAGMAQAFNITPMYWARYCKDKLDAVSAIAAMSRLVNPDWWFHQLKGQRTLWRESLLIAIGNG